MVKKRVLPITARRGVRINQNMKIKAISASRLLHKLGIITWKSHTSNTSKLIKAYQRGRRKR